MGDFHRQRFDPFGNILIRLSKNILFIQDQNVHDRIKPRKL